MRQVICVLLVLLTGCTTWTKPGASVNDFNYDNSICLASSDRAYSEALNSQPSRPATYNTNCTNYGNQSNCTSTPQNTGPQFGAIMQAGSVRDSTYKACMYSSGWHEQRK